MTVKIMEADNKMNHDELDFFIKGNIALEKGARKKPHVWLTDQGWEDIQKLTAVVPDKFGSLADDIERNGETWKEVSTIAMLPRIQTWNFPCRILTPKFWTNADCRKL